MFNGGSMKTGFKLTILIMILATGAQAGVGLPQLGPKPKAKITLTEAQIQSIKNEMHGPTKSKNQNTFEEQNTDNLEALFQFRLAEASDITNFRDSKSFEDALTFMGLALQAWNPELRNVDIKQRLVKNISTFGLVQGFIFPVMALVDKSYAIGNGGFGDLLNTMLADITPKVAIAFKNQYGVSTEFNGRNFSQISAQGRQGMWIGLLSQLDPDFYQQHKQNSQTSTEVKKKFPINNLNETDNDFINININGDRTAIAHYLKKIGKTDNSESLLQKRRLFQSSLGVSTKECALKCVEEVVTEGAKGSTFGEGVGQILQKYVPQLRSAGMVIGASYGMDKCIGSSECGGSKEQRAEEKAKKEATAKEKEAQDQKYREAMDEYRQKEISKQLEADKKDAEKMKHLQKMKEEYDKQQKEKELASDPNQQENNSESDNKDDDRQETEDEHNRNGRDIKPMLNDDETSGATFEENQQMKKNLGMPMLPHETVSVKEASANNIDWIIKTMEKEKNTKPAQVNIVYPINPNGKD